MHSAGNKPRPHAPVEVAHRTPAGFEQADAIEQRTPYQELSNGSINGFSQKMQQPVKWRPANVGALQKLALLLAKVDRRDHHPAYR